MGLRRACVQALQAPPIAELFGACSDTPRSRSKLRSHPPPARNAPVNWTRHEDQRAREFRGFRYRNGVVRIGTPLSESKPRATNPRHGTPEGAVWPPGL